MPSMSVEPHLVDAQLKEAGSEAPGGGEVLHTPVDQSSSGSLGDRMPQSVMMKPS